MGLRQENVEHMPRNVERRRMGTWEATSGIRFRDDGEEPGGVNHGACYSSLSRSLGYLANRFQVEICKR